MEKWIFVALGVSVVLNLVLGFLVVEYFRVRRVLEDVYDKESDQIRKERWAREDRERDPPLE